MIVRRPGFPPHDPHAQVADILGTFADIVQPRTFEDLERYGFSDLPT